VVSDTVSNVIMSCNAGIVIWWCISYLRGSDHWSAFHNRLHWFHPAFNLWAFLVQFAVRMM
jgi:hypothetical protein